MQPAAVLHILVKANTGPAVRELNRVQGSLVATERQGGQTAAVFKQLAKAAAVGAAGVSAASVKLAVDFDRSMRNVNSIAQLPEKRFRSLSKRVRELGGETAQAPKTLAEGLYDLVSSGFDADQSLRILRKSARAATAGLTTTEVSTKAVAAVLNAYRLPAKRAGAVSDTLFRTVDRGVITFEQLAENIGDTLPFASELGVTLTEVGAATATMTKQGLGAPETMTRIRNLLQTMIKPGEGLAKAFKELGVESGETLIKQKGLQGALQAVIGTTDGSKAALAKLFPNIRALGGALALTGGNSKAAAEDLKGMREASGATSKALAEQSKSVAYQWNKLKAQAESLAIGFGNKLLPEISKVLKLLSDPKLSGEEKLNRIAQMLSDMVSGAIPKIADAAAQAAPKVAKAFVDGFVNASFWGRLAIAGFLISKFGGRQAIASAGATIGTTMTGGVAAGFTGLRGKLIGMAKSWGPAIGVALVAAAAPRIAKDVQGLTQDFDLPKYMREPVGSLIGPIGDVEAKVQTLFGAGSKLQDFGERAEEAFKKFEKARDARGLSGLAEQARALAKQFPGAATELGRFADAAEDAARRAAGAFRDVSKLGGKSLRDIKTATANAGFTIKNTLGPDSAAARKALAENFANAAKAVKKSMDAGVISTKEGTALIEEYMVAALQNMGFSKQAALNLRKAQRAGSKQTPGASGQLRPNQRGGYQLGGRPSGDSIPSLLERGEYVLNRRAVQKVGKGNLDRLNFAAAPRFQQGGIVELLHPFNDPKGHGGSNSHLHIAAQSIEAIVALGKRLQKMGWLVGEHPAFGGIQGRHAPQGYHYTGQAIDVNWPDAGAEAGKIRALLPLLGGDLGALAPKLRRVLVEGPSSPLKSLVQAALDTTHAAAQSVVDRVGGPFEGVETGVGGLSKGALKRLWTQAGGSPKVANLMAAIALAESGGNPAARNPSGAAGLWQILGLPFPGDPFDPATNARMAVAKYQSQGLGAWEAYTRGMHRQFLQKGGLAGDLDRGFRQLRGARGGRARGRIVRGLMDKIKGVGLPDDLASTLKRLENDAAVFGEMADRAGRLSTEDAAGNPILGLVGDKTETEWLQAQLQALFEWRNAILDAEQIIAQRRERVSELVERARARLTEITDEIRAGQAARNQIQKGLDVAEKNPKRNRKLIRSLRGQLRDLDRSQDRRQGVRRAVERVLGDRSSGLIGKRADLVTARGDLLETLGSVQGIGSPMHKMTTLPALGVFGGSIFDAQLRIQDLTGEKPKVIDPSAATGPSERETLLEQLLREANLRTAVSEAHFKVFQGMPQFGGGGIVPGPSGAAVPAVVHAGEGVFTRDQMAALGSQPVVVIVQDGAVREDRIQVLAGKAAETALRRAGRAGDRGLPGGGGGLTRG